MKKPVSYKRILAYLIDILIVTVISSIFTLAIPVSDLYLDKSEELSTIMKSYQKGEIEKNEYLDKVNDISYVISKETVSTSIVTVVITTIYFVVLGYYMNGQTPGKKFMKIRVVSNDETRLTMNNYLIRGLIVDSILMNIISIAIILVLEKDMFFKVNEIMSTIFGAFYVFVFAMILFREDGRGFHDIIANTKVIADENLNAFVNEIEVVKEVNEEKKKSNKTNNKKKNIKKDK